MSLDKYNKMIALYEDAEIAVLEGKEFNMNGDVLKREDLAQIRAGRIEWERKRSAFMRKGSRFTYSRFN